VAASEDSEVRPSLGLIGASDSAARPAPMTPRLRAIFEDRWQHAGKPITGWVFPARKAKAGHIVDNTIYEPHTNAVKKVGLNPREVVLYALRQTCLTRWGDSGMDAWTLARLAGQLEYSGINDIRSPERPCMARSD
jgi:hypothetical protein